MKKYQMKRKKTKLRLLIALISSATLIIVALIGKSDSFRWPLPAFGSSASWDVIDNHQALANHAWNGTLKALTSDRSEYPDTTLRIDNVDKNNISGTIDWLGTNTCVAKIIGEVVDNLTTLRQNDPKDWDVVNSHKELEKNHDGVWLVFRESGLAKNETLKCNAIEYYYAYVSNDGSIDGVSYNQENPSSTLKQDATFILKKEN